MSDMPSPFRDDLLNAARALLATCRARGWKLATAESCTGGLIGGVLTEIPGASDVYDRGFITYSNQAKIDLLGVHPGILQSHGAVSEPVALQMATGAVARAGVDLAIGVTGIAGPGGAGNKPAGLVHLAVAERGHRIIHRKCLFSGDRSAVRLATLAVGLAMLADLAADLADADSALRVGQD